MFLVHLIHTKFAVIARFCFSFPLPCGGGLRGWVNSIRFCKFNIDSAFSHKSQNLPYFSVIARKCKAFSWQSKIL
ncbi:hypothetical protein [Helicobacter sp. 23-1045]